MPRRMDREGYPTLPSSECKACGDLQLPCASEIGIRGGWRCEPGGAGVLHHAVVRVTGAGAGTGCGVVVLGIVHGVDIREVEQVERLAQDREFVAFRDSEAAADSE